MGACCVKPKKVGAGALRYNALLPEPQHPEVRLCLIEFVEPGEGNGGTDKGGDGHRVDSIPIANGVVKAGGACDIVRYFHALHDEFCARVAPYDGFIVRVSTRRLAHKDAAPGTPGRFDALMAWLVQQGKPVWSSPRAQSRMGAADALVRIRSLECGLADTFAYRTPEELEAGFKKTMAFHPRVLRQNCGAAGQGMWLCWLHGRNYTEPLGATAVENGDILKLMDMNDHHVEYHTVKEFLNFCVRGSKCSAAGVWLSTDPGKYLGDERSLLVDQRLFERVGEGELQVLLAGSVVHKLIHKRTDGGLRGRGGTLFFEPGTTKEFAPLEASLKRDLLKLMGALGLPGEPLPLLWTATFVPVNCEGGAMNATAWAAADLNCSCVGVSKFQRVAGDTRTLADVPDDDYRKGCALTDLMGREAVRTAMAYKRRRRRRRATLMNRWRSKSSSGTAIASLTLSSLGASPAG